MKHVDLQVHSSERHDRRGQMVQGEEAALELLAAHEPLPEATEPAVADLNNPAPGLARGVAPLLRAPTVARPTTWGMQPLANMTFIAGLPQHPASAHRCLLRPCSGRGRLMTQPFNAAPSPRASWTFAPVTMTDNGTPRASTGKCGLLPSLRRRGLPPSARAQHVHHRLKHLSRRLGRPATTWLAHKRLVQRPTARRDQRLLPLPEVIRDDRTRAAPYPWLHCVTAPPRPDPRASLRFTDETLCVSHKSSQQLRSTTWQ